MARAVSGPKAAKTWVFFVKNVEKRAREDERDVHHFSPTTFGRKRNMGVFRKSFRRTGTCRLVSAGLNVAVTRCSEKR